MKTLIWISRILVGGVFIFSGFVKAIDPLGSAYKFQDYFLAFGTEWLFFTALPMALLLSTLEFIIGVGLFVGIKYKLSAWGGFLFMLFFTPLTLYIAITDPVPDCGCFGDAIIISNWETFYKNVVIFAAAIIVFVYRYKFKTPWSKTVDNILMILVTAGILGLSAYCLRYLPVIDFRPWKVGNNVTELVMSTEEVSETYLIFENEETGDTREYPASDYPWDDPEWAEVWSFKDQRREIIQPYEEAEIEDFYIQDEFGEDLTDFYMTEPGYVFMVVAYDLYRTNKQVFESKITPLWRQAEEEGHTFIILTGSTSRAIEEFTQAYKAPERHLFYLADEIELKTIIRSNPGLLLMKDGVVLAKWPHRRIPDYETIHQLYLNQK